MRPFDLSTDGTMISLHSLANARRIASAGLLLAFTVSPPAVAAGGADDSEREVLEALTRHLDSARRLAIRAASIAPQEAGRHHFDYWRLQEDLVRVRAGIEDYLVPQRAQPRDPLPVSGDYSRDAHDGEAR
jgi:RAQPRD family integrative conjugative element protein